jgi:hypothetical protein
MATRQIRKQRDLPPTRLYLDDIEDIERVIKDAYATLSEPPATVAFTYTIDETLECTAIADLEAHGGTTKQFTMGVVADSHYSTILSNGIKLHIHVPYELSDPATTLSVTTAMSAIIEDRRRPLRSLLKELCELPYIPPLTSLCTSIAVWLALSFARQPLRAIFGFVSIFLIVGTLAAIFSGLESADVLCLYFKRQNERVQSEERKVLLSKIHC